MAQRPFFFTRNGFVWKKDVEFTWYPGFALNQQQKSIHSLHEAIVHEDSELTPLEISTKSDNPLGVSLSAFSLKLDGTWLENVFQSSKVFRQGGPYPDIRDMDPKKAKHDPRLKESGELTGFLYQGERFDLLPRTAFYDYLFIRAVLYSGVDYQQIGKYNGFTDIAFNPQRSLNTQARSVAIIRLLMCENMDLKKVSEDKEAFIAWHKQKVRG